MPGTKYELNEYQLSYLYLHAHSLSCLMNAYLNLPSSAQLPLLAETVLMLPEKAGPPLCSWNACSPVHLPPLLLEGVVLSAWYLSLYLTLYPPHRSHSVSAWRWKRGFHGATQKVVICLGHAEVPSAGLSIVFSNSHISTICTCFPLRERTVSFTEFRSSVLPPLPVSFHPNLSVSRVCYQGFPDSPLPLQLGFLFTCWDEPLTTQPAFLISFCTHGIRKISCLMRPATMLLGLWLLLLCSQWLSNCKSPITSNLGIAYHCLIILGSWLRKWQAAYGVSSFSKKKFFERSGHCSSKDRCHTQLVPYQWLSNLTNFTRVH